MAKVGLAKVGLSSLNTPENFKNERTSIEKKEEHKKQKKR